MAKTKKIAERIIVMILVVVMVLENGVLDVLGAPSAIEDTVSEIYNETGESGTAAEEDTAAEPDTATGAVAGIGAVMGNLMEETDAAVQEEESYIIGENKEKREPSVKHFLTEAGDYMAVMYPEPVHYEKDGVWEEIDNTLVLTEGQDSTDQSYVNSASDVNIEIARYSDAEDLVSIQTEAGVISWSLVTEDVAVQEEMEEPEDTANVIETLTDEAAEREQQVSEFILLTEEREGEQAAVVRLAPAEEGGAEEEEPGDTVFIEAKGSREGKTAAEYNEEQTTISGLTSGGTYEDILPGVDIQYILDSVNLKENIILKTADAVREQYTFRVSHPDMEMVLEEDGSVIVKGKGEDAEVSYTFLRPFMYDDADALSTDIEYILTPDGADATILSICPDTTWLLSEERSYPVTIDPVTETSRNVLDIIDTYVSENGPDGYDEVWDFYELYIGNDPDDFGKARILIKFNNLPQLDRGDIIYKGVTMMYQYDYDTYGVQELDITAHKITGSWSRETLTWANKPNYDATVLDYQTVTSEVKVTKVAKLLQFDITSLARLWYDDPEHNYGFMLQSEDEDIWTNAKIIASDNKDYPQEARPSAIFYYRNTAGLEDYWSYHSVDAGRAGTGYVNDFNGNLTFIHEDISTIGNVMPITVSHVYNLCDTDETIRCGNGWRLNVHQRLEPTGMTDYPYVYTDGDGTKHYFYKDKDDGNKLKDEDGLGLTITQESPPSGSETDLHRIITCKDKSQMVFDCWGYLRRSIDPNGNVISYNYAPKNDAIVNYLHNIRDGQGNIVIFHYSEDISRLLHIEEQATGRKTSFSYDSAGNLSAITYPDGTVTRYTYDGGKLIRAEHTKSDAAGFDYVLDYKVPRVSLIREYGSTGQVGRSVKLSYKNGNTTSFKYPGLDGSYDTSDDLIYNYDFDNCGRVLTVHDTEGTASSYKYYTDGNINNQLKESGTLKKTVHNYLGNPGFDGGTSWDDDRWVSIGVGTTAGYSVDRVSNAGYEGGTSIRVTMTGGNQGRPAAAQTVNGLTKGTYTLSAYVKTQGVVPRGEENAHGATIGIDYLNGSKANTTVICEDAQRGTSDSAIDDGWERISVTFEVPENGTNIRAWGGLNNAGGQAWYDCFQLEKGEVPEGYNFVNNPGFEYSQWGGVTLNVWARENMGTGDGRVSGNPKNGTYSARITGNPDHRRYIQQSINVSGGENDVYSLSGWARANAVPGKTFRIGARIHYSNGSTAERYFDFDPYLTGWQYAGGMLSTDDQKASTNLTYSRIDVFVEYANQCNTAWFDAIQLTRDDGETYVYDDEGNLISVRNAVEKDSFQSDEDGNLTNLVTPTGSSYTYGYDTKQNLLWAKGSDGLSYRFTYDQYGNPLTSTATGNGAGNAGGIRTGTGYHIINKESGLVLDASGNAGDPVWSMQQNNLDAGTDQQWILTADGDGYLLESASKAGWFLTVKGGGTGDGTSVVLQARSAGSAAQRFSLSPADGGGYRILAANTGYGKALTNSDKTEKAGITIETKDEAKGYQVWHLEPATGSDLVMESSQTYTAGGRHVSTVTDTRGNVTSYEYGTAYQGRLLTGITDAGGGTTTYGYDSNDRITSVSRTGTDAAVAYTYTDEKLSSISHNGFTYDFIYDVYGNVALIEAGGQTLIFHERHEANGPVWVTHYGNGDSILYDHDRYEQVTGVTYEDGASFGYRYDSLGNLIQSEDSASGIRYHFKYDSLKRPTYMTTSHGQELRVRYDDKNRVSENISVVDGTATTTEYVYGDASANQIPDVAYGVKIDGEELLSTIYDGLGRTRSQTLDLDTDYEMNYSYQWGEDWNSTALVRQLAEKGESFLYAWNYEYDALGNITEVRLGTDVKLNYTYDSLSQLVRVDDAFEGKTHTYTYDAGGNITSHSIHAYTREADPGTAETTITYGYEDTGWKDKLTSYNGESFTYDVIGNPLTWRGGMTLTWKHGRKLASLTKDGTTSTYSYDDESYRISKQVGDTVTTYYRAGEILLTEITGEDRLDYLYDASGLLLGFKYNGTAYYYRKNLQGDITGILDNTGEMVVSYTYDTWGRPLTCTGSMAESIGQKNPFRYRGYYYDAETGLYYLNSRYYDPEVGRFINADTINILAVSPTALTDKNLYAYCDNNPVMRKDSSGKIWLTVGIIAAGGLIGGLMGAFSAAATGGNVLEGAIEGCLTGLLGAACGILSPYSMLATAGMAAAGGFVVDAGVQATSHYIKNKSMNSFKYDWGRSIKTAAQTGLGAAIPQLGNAGKNVVDAIGTALIWAEGSVLIATTDVVVTNSRTAARNYTNSRTNTRTNTRMYGWASEETKYAFYASRTVIGR